MSLAGYDHLNLFYGDIHNHCAVSYGHGSVEEAYTNARMQLDFASVTAHAAWPDIPRDETRLEAVVAYHEQGFERAASQWTQFQEATNMVHEDGRFVSLLSFEWHSMRYGDHNIYFKDGHGEIIRAPDIMAMRERLRELRRAGVETFLLPHHIGYHSGYRGIAWDDYTPEFSPVVEMFSMHGCAEGPDAPYPYLHTMGPRDWRSTMHYGLQQGHRFGVVGSTDHHSAHPGSYGHGRMGAWATELTRDGIWQAIAARRTYALTGDRIALAFTVNGQPMGAVMPPTSRRQIDCEVRGGGELDYVEIMYCNRPIQRWSSADLQHSTPVGPWKIYLEVGWGEQDKIVNWDARLEIDGGRLRSVEPRFRGRQLVEPEDTVRESHAFSAWQQPDDHTVSFQTRTWGNPTSLTPSTQGLCLEIEGDPSTRVRGLINGQPVDIVLDMLREGPRSTYLGGFLTSAFCFHRAVPEQEYTLSRSLVHEGDHLDAGWYYARVRQTNGHWAWSSPIWIDPRSPDASVV